MACIDIEASHCPAAISAAAFTRPYTLDFRQG
jgi:hypothetical protein